MKSLIARQDHVPGFWRIRHGTRTVAAMVQPRVEVELGMLPTAEDVRRVVLELFPDLPIASDTPVVIDVNR